MNALGLTFAICLVPALAFLENVKLNVSPSLLVKVARDFFICANVSSLA